MGQCLDLARAVAPEAPELDESARAELASAATLLLPFDEAARRLVERLGNARAGGSAEVQADAVLDGFLYAAGMSQVVEDYLHRDRAGFLRASRQLREMHPRLGPPLARSAEIVARLLRCLQATQPVERRVLRWQRELSALVDLLAARIPSPTSTPVGELVARAEGIVAAAQTLPARLRSTVVRPPNCYSRFDQRPEDCARLVEQLAKRYPDRERPLLVLGLRTSGSYLAPLCGAFLTAAGYRSVTTRTTRPSQLLRTDEGRAIAKIAARRGLAILVDDPPRTGTQLAASAAALERLGFERTSIVLLLQVPSLPLPERLRHLEAVVLPIEDWTISERLSAESVGGTLARMLGDASGPHVIDVEVVESPSADRGHLRAAYAVRVADRDGAETRHDICVEGVGLGHFGDRVLALAGVAPAYRPRLYGLERGLLYRDRLPTESQLSATQLADEAPRIAQEMARYAHLRAATLALSEDVTPGTADTASEVTADALGRAFGVGRHVVRGLAAAAASQLVETRRPSVIDGYMASQYWFACDPAASNGASGTLMKVGSYLGEPVGRDLYTQDPVFDLAQAATAAAIDGVPELGDLVRSDFAEMDDRDIDDERWLIYRLIHYRQASRCARELFRSADAKAGLSRFLEIERLGANALQGYYGGRFLADLPVPANGPLCALDIDGVLETRWLDFPTIAPAGARALRALARHGYRAVLATGRSLPEVRSRCEAYRLAGGVAEYGSVVYDHVSGDVQETLSAVEKERLDALRDALDSIPRVVVDRAFAYSVRAYEIDDKGCRGAVTSSTLTRAIADSGGTEHLRLMPGILQSDIVGASVDKARGLVALAGLLGEHGGQRPLLALAVGDAAADIPMFALSARAFAPSNAEPEVRGYATILRAAYGNGVLDAVGRLLGHRPGKCETCAPPEQSRQATLLLAALAGLNGGRGAKVASALRLHRTVRSARAV